MQSRMDKYSNQVSSNNTRTERNKQLYQNVKESSIEEYDIKNNESVIGDNSEVIDVNNIKKILDSKYNKDIPKRTIIIPEDEDIVEEKNFSDTKEYDLNAILVKAKKGQSVDYNKERLKIIRDAQYDILNNLDLELKKIEEYPTKNKEAEQTLIDLINTITELENKNKEATTSIPVVNETKKNENVEKVEEVKKEEKLKTHVEDVKKVEKHHEEKVLSKEDKLSKTLEKLDINIHDYNEFADIFKRDKSAILIKIIIFIIVIVLIAGGVYILNNLLDLGLF